MITLKNHEHLRLQAGHMEEPFNPEHGRRKKKQKYIKNHFLKAPPPQQKKQNKTKQKLNEEIAICLPSFFSLQLRCLIRIKIITVIQKALKNY